MVMVIVIVIIIFILFLIIITVYYFLPLFIYVFLTVIIIYSQRVIKCSNAPGASGIFLGACLLECLLKPSPPTRLPGGRWRKLPYTLRGGWLVRVRGYIKHRLRLVSDGRGSGSSMPSPGVEPNTSLDGNERKKGRCFANPQEETRECVGGVGVGFPSQGSLPPSSTTAHLPFSDL